MKNSESDSSLELLLDTMCNTFGAVMFIAISLVVVLSMLPEKEADAPDSQAELQQLELLLREAMQKQSLDQEFLQRQQQDPRQRRLAELIRLQEAETNAESRLKIDQAQEASLNLQEAIQSRQRNDQTQEEQKIRSALAALREKIAQLPKQSTLNFRRLRASELAPFFLLVQQDRVWKVGPHRQAGKEDRPDPDVKTVRENDSIRCIPVPEAGIPLLEGEELSTPMQTLLQTIPRDRVACFVVSADSARAFVTAREILKKNRIQHGLIPQSISESSQFVYRYVSDAKNEY